MELSHGGERSRQFPMLFDVGAVVATPGAISLMTELEIEPFDLLKRHMSGDWGKVSPADARENRKSLEEGFRILSSYGDPGQTIWLITEADRSVTTFLLPEEY